MDAINDSTEHLELTIVEGIEKIPRAQWDAILSPDDSPFLEWDWLAAMERSGSPRASPDGPRIIS